MLHLKLTLNLCQRILSFEALSMHRKMSSISEDVLIEEKGRKGILTLNRPEALNALNLSMIKKIHLTLVKWENEKDFVIVKAVGNKAFCAGGDVKGITEACFRGERIGEELFNNEYQMNAVIGYYKPIYIALIDGITMGGGVGLSVHGKYRIATERTLFAMPETAIGLFPDAGSSHFLPKLKGKLGMYLALTGYRLKGIDVLHAGLATHYVDSKCIGDILKEILSDDCCNENDLLEILTQYKLEGKEFSQNSYLEKINHCFGAPTIEEIIKRLKDDDSEWAKKQIETLCKMSPTSMKISKILLEKSKGMTLRECMQLEYRLAVNTMNRGEFYEGVRALLVDKDQNPKWNPPTLEKVTEEIIEAHFKHLPADKELKYKL